MKKYIAFILVVIFLLYIVQVNNAENLKNFEGTSFRLSKNWNTIIPIDLQNKPIKY